ncbi:MAG: GNAT family N-acetyltransferase, partial [Pseudomonadota bacterium]|nr:GNAT family N-acetyltransferase [Pseudomonadota bacterium]
GWSNPCLSVVQKSIDASLFSATIYLDNNLVGCGRVIGDGAMYFYIQDVIIHPEHQNKGLGSKIMNTLIAHLESCCAPGATIGLLAAHGKESFYLKFGFKPRDGQSLGLGMCRFI